MAYRHSESSKSVPVHRVAIVRSFAQLFADIGAPVEQGFRRAGLPLSSLDNVNDYLPSHRFFAFLLDMAVREGVEDLGFRVGQRFGANGADPRLVQRLRQSPTLYRAVCTFRDLVEKTVSHSRIGLVRPSGRGGVFFFHRPSCDVRNPAHPQIAWFGLLNMIGVVQAVAGPDWQPTEIGLTMGRPPARSIRNAFPNTRIRLSQPFSYLLLDEALLALPGDRPPATQFSAPADFFESIQSGLSDSLEQLLHAYVREHPLTVRFAAELCDTSPRTLQRRLESNGTTFSEVVDRVHFRVAGELLRDPDMKVADVARALRYSDPTHFSRAFRRISGIAPKVFRQQFLARRLSENG